MKTLFKLLFLSILPLIGHTQNNINSPIGSSIPLTNTSFTANNSIPTDGITSLPLFTNKQSFTKSLLANRSELSEVLKESTPLHSPNNTQLTLENAPLESPYKNGTLKQKQGDFNAKSPLLTNTSESFSVASNCSFNLSPDLNLIASNSSIENEINTAVNKFSQSYLGNTPPTSQKLSSAIAAYNALNINVVNGTISGNSTSSFVQTTFLKIFAQHLVFNPNDAAIQEKANNAVWWISKQFCAGTMKRDVTMYSYQKFARPVSLLNKHLKPEVKKLFAYTLYIHTRGFKHFWSPNYDTNYQLKNQTINTDVIFNLSDALLAYSLWHDTDAERYRYMRAYKRYMNRFFSYAVGTNDGLKKDGSGFHHWVAYNNYMYAFNTAASVISYLKETSFEIDPSNYKIFRDAVYFQYIQSNDMGIQALSTSGRNPHNRRNPINQKALKNIAITGGDILGLSTADPLLAGLYNRIYGIDPAFNYTGITSLKTQEGAFQNNHSLSSVFRKSNWIAVNKGFSNNMWGAEIYDSKNRYGRYQSYGALEIIYEGTMEYGNGYDVNTWNWNFNPGTTTIALPWYKLHAEYGRIDELQRNRFVGALSFKNKNSNLLKATHGTWGVFAMDFQEIEGQGWGNSYGGNNHNATFAFKKSTFTFDDLIICLGSGIKNNNATNNTITTLYQRKNNNSNDIIVNGSIQNGASKYSISNDNWLISNYNTGFYIVSEEGNLNVWTGNQQVPLAYQTNQNISNNPSARYSIAYINHGKAPKNAGYEYVVLPDTNTGTMLALSSAFLSGNKPYTVHQKNASAHIIEHLAKHTWGYAIFSDNTNIMNPGLLTDVDKTSLIMYEINSAKDVITLSVSNPDIGYNSRQYTPSKEKKIRITIKGGWELQNSSANIQIIGRSATRTIIEYTTVDGLPIEGLFQKNDTESNQSEDATIDLNLLNTIDENKLVIYPNPVRGNSIYVKHPESAGNVSCTIINILGQVIHREIIKNHTVNISNLPSGTYTASFTINNERITRRFIKK
ncbi:MAG: T9SS type A sorting domain-containing protein [Flavobacteriaceae bacterium]|nr:T9SS type A sorting domain-containing protein [Flavobacteriaceae bacterium]